MEHTAKIYVAGHRGLVGSALMHNLRNRGYSNFLTRTHAELDLLGLPYEAPFFGQDVLHAPDSTRLALFSHDHDVAIYRIGRLAVLGMDGKVRDFLYQRAGETFTPAAPDAELDALGIAYFQTATELFQAHHYE